MTFVKKQAIWPKPIVYTKCLWQSWKNSQFRKSLFYLLYYLTHVSQQPSFTGEVHIISRTQSRTTGNCKNTLNDKMKHTVIDIWWNLFCAKRAPTELVKHLLMILM